MDATTVILSAIVISSIGALFYNFLPVYLGTAQDSKGLDNRAIGLLSSAFFLGYNIITISAFYWIRKWNWRTVTLVATPLAALGLYSSTLTDNYISLLMATALAGGAFAALYSVGTTILADTSNPARWYGLKIAAEAITGAILLLILPDTLIALYGFDGMIAGLLLCMLLLSPLLLLLPVHGIKTQEQEMPHYRALDARATGINHWAIWCALFATLAFFSGASAIWAFMERLGNTAGFDASAIGTLLAATLGCATLGSLATAGIGRHFGNIWPFMACLASIIISLLLLANSSHFSLYAAGACLFATGFGAGLPFAVAEVAELDSDGRYVVLSVAAIGMGAMIGPGVAGSLYQDESAAGILTMVGASMVVAAVLMSVAHRQKNS